MTNEEQTILNLRKLKSFHNGSYGTDIDRAIKALKEPCEDTVSRQAVEDKLLKLCNELEGVFANIRMEKQDESVCGLCEYDCPAPYECPGFDIEDCFKLADEIRHKWQSTKDLSSVKPQEKTGHWIEKDGFDGDTYYDCSECGESWTTIEGTPWHNGMNYCPNCGCRMVEPQEREESE